MKKLFLLLTLLTVSTLLFNCNKEELVKKPGKTEKVQLNFSQSELKSKGVITSNQTITGDVDYYFSFWLTPAPDAKGLFEITSMDGSIIYYSSANAENAIDWKAPATGTYLMEVSGTYNGTFSFVNITINVTDNYVPPVSNTYPVRFYNARIDNSNVIIDVVVTKGIYAVSPYDNYDWFYVKRINGLNFIGNQSVTNENDSVRFQLSFPATNGIYIEFMAGMHDGSTNGLWLTPSSYSGCLLYSGSENLPYNASGYFFGFRLVTSGNSYEIKSYSGTTILNFSGTENTIPGEAGDLSINNYQVRWTGFTHYIKTSLNAPVLRYKIGENGSWTYTSLNQFSQNNDYWYLTFPNLSGELFFQWGTGNTNTNFTPANSEMENSMYYVSNLGMLAKNI
ncbi:MAG TPA: hypothetical protein PLE28_00570 [bacterium]|mgnify:CR=1 FL=1|nr:hypothetical protein [bacterium]